MKTLKLDHAEAEAARSRSLQTTWRMYDDKDLRVNDDIELIDKATPSDPSTWLSIGPARIDEVAEKRVKDLQGDDLAAIKLKDIQDVLVAARKRYGSQVDEDTPLKIIRFTLGPEPGPATSSAVLHVKEANLYADGGSRGNPGPSASGFAIVTMDNQIVVKKGVYLGVTTNNQAEYQALKLGLEEAKDMGIRVVHVYMDSLLVVNQMLNIFKVKNRDLWPIHDAVRRLVPLFELVSFTHVPRELNKVADAAVNEALDNAEQSASGNREE